MSAAARVLRSGRSRSEAEPPGVPVERDRQLQVIPSESACGSRRADVGTRRADAPFSTTSSAKTPGRRPVRVPLSASTSGHNRPWTYTCKYSLVPADCALATPGITPLQIALRNGHQNPLCDIDSLARGLSHLLQEPPTEMSFLMLASAARQVTCSMWLAMGTVIRGGLRKSRPVPAVDKQRSPGSRAVAIHHAGPARVWHEEAQPGSARSCATPT